MTSHVHNAAVRQVSEVSDLQAKLIASYEERDRATAAYTQQLADSERKLEIAVCELQDLKHEQEKPV